MPYYSNRDTKLLFARSGGRCAFRQCRQELVVRETNDLIGHIAHIVARSDGGPRSDSSMPDQLRNSYENLILLCPTHHAEIDSTSGSIKWPTDTLRKMKSDHEQWVAEQLAVGTPITANVSQIGYVNVPRLAGLAILAGIDLDISYIDGPKLLVDTGFLTARLMRDFKQVISQIALRGNPLDSIDLSDEGSVGLAALFSARFRTKNMPMLHAAQSGKARFHGSIDKDPHIYRKLRNTRFVLPIDPKWILSMTAWADFSPSGGHSQFAGACIIKHVDASRSLALATPIYIGTPISAWDTFL